MCTMWANHNKTKIIGDKTAAKDLKLCVCLTEEAATPAQPVCNNLARLQRKAPELYLPSTGTTTHKHNQLHTTACILHNHGPGLL